MNDPLKDLRRQISAIDGEILKLMKRRFALCRQAIECKDSIEDRAREEELRNLWLAESDALGLSREFALELLVLLLAESKRIQRER